MAKRHMIETYADVAKWDVEDLDAFLAVDEFNAENGIDVQPTINPTLGLELVYEPIGYCFKGIEGQFLELPDVHVRF